MADKDFKICGLPCEVYSRIVGYFRPVREWNLGKKEEFKDRKPLTGGGVYPNADGKDTR